MSPGKRLPCRSQRQSISNKRKERGRWEAVPRHQWAHQAGLYGEQPHPASPDSQNGLGPQGVLPSGLGFGTKVLARLLRG